MMALLEFRNVTKRFQDGLREVAVLDDISFEMFECETVGVLASR
jgi:ABC-type glutathione transport system ATPase component